MLHTCDMSLFGQRPQHAPVPASSPANLTWLENEQEIYALAQQSLGWIAGTPFWQFWHPEDAEMVALWPVRLIWVLWWTGPYPNPTTPEELHDFMLKRPVRSPDQSVGMLIDPPAPEHFGDGSLRPYTSPILPAGTRFRIGPAWPDFCDGFDTQLVTVVSGPWSETHLQLAVGRAGEPCLIARLSLVPLTEPLRQDPGAAAELLERLREIGRGR